MEELSETRLASPIVGDLSGARPYPPSFMDRIMDASQRLAGPFWLPYLALLLLIALLNHALAWADGWVPAFSFNPLLLCFPLWICLPPVIMIYLNSVAEEALASFSCSSSAGVSSPRNAGCWQTRIGASSRRWHFSTAYCASA